MTKALLTGMSGDTGDGQKAGFDSPTQALSKDELIAKLVAALENSNKVLSAYADIEMDPVLSATQMNYLALALAADHKAAERWRYCPECGCDGFKRADWNNENECVDCGQSWFPDIDYTNTVRGHLKKSRPDRYKKTVTTQEREAALEAVDILLSFALMEPDDEDDEGIEDIRMLHNKAETIRTALQQPSIPKGWRLVPEEPTREMTYALDTNCEAVCECGSQHTWVHNTAGALAKAIAAAPTKDKE